MHDQQTVLEIIEKTEKRRTERRAFMRAAAGATAMVGGLSMLAACGDDDSPTPTPTPTPTATSSNVDVQVLNFALQLEYLEAQFYSYAAFGVGLPSSSLTGVGTQGAVQTGSGAGFPRAVDFSSDLVVGQYAREIAYDEIAHVNFLRTALGSSAAAQPAINISGTATGSFTAAARAAGVVTSSQTFDPYASPNNFLLGAFIFEDVGVTAYKGASPLITNKTYLEAAAGILAAEAYHAGLVRTALYRRGITTRDLVTNAGRISDARDSLDGSSDLDQGIEGSNIGVLATAVSNIVPADSNAIAFSRTPQQVLSIVYLGSSPSTASFFPSGVNGSFTTTS